MLRRERDFCLPIIKTTLKGFLMVGGMSQSAGFSVLLLLRAESLHALSRQVDPVIDVRSSWGEQTETGGHKWTVVLVLVVDSPSKANGITTLSID
jgi:hypothetical protein